MKCIDILNYGVDILILFGLIIWIGMEIYHWWDWRRHEKRGDGIRYNEKTKQYDWIKKE
jgi:nicotinamide riboside transporter PnuC